MSVENMEGLVKDIVWLFGSVEDIKPFGFFFSNFKIRHADLLMEGNIFFLDPVFGTLDSFEALMRIDIEIECDGRFEVFCGKMTELADPSRIKASCTALVGNS